MHVAVDSVSLWIQDLFVHRVFVIITVLHSLDGALPWDKFEFFECFLV